MSKPIPMALVLVFCLWASGVYARGFVVGLNAGSSEVQDLGPAASVGVFAGYRFDAIFGAEVGYNRLGTWTGFDQGVAYTTAVNNVDVSLTAGCHVSRRTRLFGRLGFVDWSTIGTAGGGEHRVTGSSASNDLLEELHQVFYGLGLSYRLTRHVGLRMEYRLYRAMAVDGHDLDINSLLFGASYHFSG